MYKYRSAINKAVDPKRTMNEMCESNKVRLKYLDDLQIEITRHFEKNDICWDESKQRDVVSRDIYERETSPENGRIEESLVLAFLYLLRGYCTFWVKRPPIGIKKLEWYEAASNDNIQAFYVSSRMYNILNVDGGRFDINERLYDFSRIGNMQGVEKKQYGYIIWWMTLLVNILNGNIYRKIHNDESAFDFYCKGIRQFDNKWDISITDLKGFCNMGGACKSEDCNNGLHKRFAKMLPPLNRHYCKTIVKVKFEKAKIYFDNGQFLESLKWYIKALRDLIVLSYTNKYAISDSGKLQIKMFCKLTQIITVLDRKKEQLAFDRDRVQKLFEDNLVHASGELNQIKSVCDVKYHYLVSDILARIGYVLHTIRKHSSDYGSQDSKKWDYKPYFRSKEIFGYTNCYASYGTLFITKDRKDEGKPTVAFDDYVKEFASNPERMFSVIAGSKMAEAIDGGRICTSGCNKDDDFPRERLKTLALDLGRMSLGAIENFVTTPRILNGYLMRRGYLASAEGTAANKLVVLRRWQSYNPIIPRPHGSPLRRQNVPGGGYLLLWEGKGIAIDPGFGFIQNLYDEGFSIEDLDAVVITHAHIDHDNDLSGILTLLHEWNMYWKETSSINKPEEKVIDLFLNEGSYRKYHSWLYSPAKIVRKIELLQVNAWGLGNSDDGKRQVPRIIGRNMEIDLSGKEGYSMNMQIIPAVHHEIISENSAIGIKMRLHKKGSKDIVSIIGFTGDTYAYDGGDDFPDIGTMYMDCNILVAHLGDIKFREIRSLSGVTFNRDDIEAICPDPKQEEKEKIENLKNFVSLLKLVDMRKVEGQTYSELARSIKNTINADDDYRYSNHLGIRGIFDLHCSMCNHASQTSNGANERILLIGELPEELATCRHMFARFLNSQVYRCPNTGNLISHGGIIKCFTADIGMHVKIEQKEQVTRDRMAMGRRAVIKPRISGKCALSVRCYRCNQNTEMVNAGKHYHDAGHVYEIVVKRIGNSLVYLCGEEKCKHNTYPDAEPQFFIGNTYEKSV